MSSEGNHGGGSRLESETAMLFLPVNGQSSGGDINFDTSTPISQIDLAVTIAHLTSLPIPSFSRGILIEPLLKNVWRDDTKRLTCANIENLKQLASLLDDSEFITLDGLGHRVLQQLNLLATSSSAKSMLHSTQQGFALARDLQNHLVRVVATKSHNFLVGVTIVLVMLLSIINMRRACNRLLMPLMNHSERLTCLGAILAPVIMLNSTDFIEMEHLLWRPYSMAVFASFCLVAIRSHSIESISKDMDYTRVSLFAISYVINISWNLAGSSAQHDWGWPWHALSIIIMCNFTRQTNKLKGAKSFGVFAFGFLVLTSRYIEETAGNDYNVPLLQVITLIILILASSANMYILSKEDTQATSIVQKLATSWMWFVFLLSRSRNYGFLISNVIMEASLNNIANSFQFNPIMRAITYLQFANNAFYSQGNTNLFSSLDIKPAFYGQTQYNIILAVPLIACSTFGSQIYWYIKLFQRVQGEKEQERMSIRPRLIDQTNTSKLIPEGTKDAIKDFVDMRNFLTIAYYMFVCMVLRDHLFIWSVLSPKLVYLFMTTITVRLVTTTISNLPHFIAKTIDGTQDEIKYKKIID
jgi:ethanolaminephosphotransferase